MKEYNRFCKEYIDKVKIDKDIIENPCDDPWLLKDNRCRIDFQVTVKYWYPGVFNVGGYREGLPLITLDDEDLQYLYDKYILKVKEEADYKVKQLEEEIKRIKEQSL